MSKMLLDYAELAKQIHPTKNKGIDITKISYGSAKKLWWTCSKNHEWQMPVKKRTLRGDKCPYCSGKKICIDNCLSTRFPEIAKGWHPTKNNKTPYDVMPGSEEKAWWLGKCGHEWEMMIMHRTDKRQKSGCPYCAGKKVCIDNCLATRFPEIAKEWHPTKNKNIEPTDILPKSNKKYWWIAKCGHTWKAATSDRTKGETGCPKCRHSKGEKRVEKYLKSKKINYITQKRFNDCKNQKTLPFDFYIDNKFLIEYQGEQHYRKRYNITEEKFERMQLNDEIKREYCKNKGIPLLEICYKDYNRIEEIIEEFIWNN